MRSLFWLLVVFAAAVALVLLARVDSGYVLLFYPPWRVEMSMVFFALAALASFLLLYYLFRLLGNALALPATAAEVRDGRIAFVGGINISDVYSSGSSATRSPGADRKKTNWRDTHASIEGPVVAEFQKLFLETWEKTLRAGDIMSMNGVPVDIGPTRHGITRGTTIYFFDPSGNRLETFGGYSAYQMDPDSRPITWTQDQMTQAVFYYAQELNETFLSVYT